MTMFLAGLALGVAGSAHCLGMCGPLVLTFGRSLAPSSRAHQVRHAALYHAGRLLTYVALAIPAGFAGQALVLRGFGRALAIVAATLLLAAALASARFRLPGRIGALWATGASRAAGAASRWGRSHAVAGPLLTGAANGLVPCGLVYAAVTAAAAMGSSRDAVVLMVGFGAGTVPALLAVSLSAASIPAAWRPRLRRLTPIVLALTAALLLLRGVTSSSTPHHHPSSPAVSPH
jgi:sulfite exporter TauE/SafE